MYLPRMIPRKECFLASSEQKSRLDGSAAQKTETVAHGTALLAGKRGEFIFTALPLRSTPQPRSIARRQMMLTELERQRDFHGGLWLWSRLAIVVRRVSSS